MCDDFQKNMENTRLPHLSRVRAPRRHGLSDNIAVFVRVVELGNLSARAATCAFRRRSASNRIKELEKHLGVRLFNRTTRQLMPPSTARFF